MSPFEVLLDAQLALVNSPEWGMKEGDKYPKPIHLAHLMIRRAERHLGIRALEGYHSDQSATAALFLLDRDLIEQIWEAGE